MEKIIKVFYGKVLRKLERLKGSGERTGDELKGLQEVHTPSFLL